MSPAPLAIGRGDDSMGVAGKSAFYLNAAPIDWIMDVMGSILFDPPVVEETGLEDEFDVKLERGEPTFENIAEAFRAAGIELVPDSGEVDFLVMEPDT